MRRIVLFLFIVGACPGNEIASQASEPGEGAVAVLSLDALFAEFGVDIQSCQEAYWKGESLLLFKNYEVLWSLLKRSCATLELTLQQGKKGEQWNRLANILLAVCFYTQEVQHNFQRNRATSDTQRTPGSNEDFQELLREAPLVGGVLQVLVQAARVHAQLREKGESNPDDARIAQEVCRQSSYKLDTVKAVLSRCHFSKNWHELTRRIEFSQERGILPKAALTPEIAQTYDSSGVSAPECPSSVAVGAKELAESSALFSEKILHEKEEKTPLPSVKELNQFLSQISPSETTSGSFEGAPVELPEGASRAWGKDIELMALAGLEVLDPNQAGSYHKERMDHVQKALEK